MVIPAEITARHGVVQEDVFRRGPEAKGIEDAVFEMATLANDHMATARGMFKEEGMGGKVPAMAMPVFLAGVRGCLCSYLLIMPYNLPHCVLTSPCRWHLADLSVLILF